MAFRQAGKHVISSLKLRESVEPAALQSAGKHDWFSSNMIGLKKKKECSDWLTCCAQNHNNIT